MNYYYITGASRGIGKAIAELLLKDENNFVTGISRSRSIRHKNYRHVLFDLSDVEALKDLRFELPENPARVCLINNSGGIGAVKPVGKLPPGEIIANFNLNLIAPCLLMNHFMQAFQAVPAEKIIINMSSGAGKNPVGGWSVYCASKAGLDMFSRVAALEERVRAKENFRVLAIAPGVVDTEMQSYIRSVPEEDFSRLKDFIGYKKSGQLAKPEAVAEKYVEIINRINTIEETVIAAKDY